MDEKADDGVEIVEDALVEGDPSAVIWIRAQLGDLVLITEMIEKSPEQKARDLVIPSPRGERVQGPEDDRHQAHAAIVSWLRPSTVPERQDSAFCGFF